VAERYDAIVVGSGFGGAVAACRLAQAGLRVAILERGRRYPLGSFPRDWANPLNGWLWQESQGLFDVRPINEMTIVQGAAYGGGSHLYANVHLRAPADVFQHGWPRGYSRSALDGYYDLVAYMLDITSIGEDQPLGVPLKTRRLERVAERLGRAEQLCRPTLAVNFGDPETLRPNKFGVPQYGCRHCGECDIGCNFQAKNTLDLNYLVVAERHGAQARTRCEVTRIAPDPEGYQVTFTDHEAGTQQSINATTVVLAAGAVNTSELLLRCRDEHHTLPDLSDRLGHGYSGNGDFLAFAVNTAEMCEPWSGPTITTGIVYDRGQGSDRHWFIFEEGGYPSQISRLIDLVGEAGNFGGLRVPAEGFDAVREAARERIRHGPKDDTAADTMVFLAMGRDSADGRIELLPVTHELCVRWNLRENLGLYETEQRLCEDIARELGGEVALNPLWETLRLPVSVHNLGGCLLADDPRTGVVDSNGEVFGYPNLFVLDGACLPSATGVNPSHTIAAVAERNIEAAIRRMPGMSRWAAPQREHAVPVMDPLARVRIPRGGTAPPSMPHVGLAFTETTHGALTRGPAHLVKEATPGITVSLRLDLATASIADFVDDPAHRLAATGTICVEGLTSRGGARVRNGLVHLLAAGDGPASRRVLYTLPFFGADGKPYLLDGYKDIRDRGRFDLWGASTTVYTRIRRGHTPRGGTIAAGELRLSLAEWVRELSTVRVTGTADPIRQAVALLDLGRPFAESLWEVFLRPRIPLLPEQPRRSHDAVTQPAKTIAHLGRRRS
jgi:cholesterol oxidase